MVFSEDSRVKIPCILHIWCGWAIAIFRCKTPLGTKKPTSSPNFSMRLKAQYEKMVVNAVENQQLAQLRDWLLPLLMNGQATVA